jgi:hypothetical protein
MKAGLNEAHSRFHPYYGVATRSLSKIRKKTHGLIS